MSITFFLPALAVLLLAGAVGSTSGTLSCAEASEVIVSRDLTARFHLNGKEHQIAHFANEHCVS